MLIATRSIPLSQDTRTAWSSANVKLAKRDFDILKLQAYIQKHNVEALINLGNLDYDYTNLNIPVFNTPASIRFVSHPAALRRNMNAFIPPLNMNGPHWHKNGGFGGKGKAFHAEECDSVLGGVVQQHIDGEEFRVITVGGLIVQAHRKEVLDGISNFVWHWAGVDGIKKNGIIPHIKAAVEFIPNFERTVLGWDIIVGDKPYTIEINTSPGVNELTAARIVRAIRGLI